jgi:hypothetical protein
VRTYGRIPNPYLGLQAARIGIDFAVGISPIGVVYPTADKIWVEVTTTDDGYDDAVYLTTLIQVLLLFLNESPFFANYGIPAKESVIQQIAPDFYISQTQQQFSQYFASLTIARQSTTPPTYLVNAVTHQGFRVNTAIPVPQ